MDEIHGQVACAQGFGEALKLRLMLLYSKAGLRLSSIYSWPRHTTPRVRSNLPAEVDYIDTRLSDDDSPPSSSHAR